MRTFVVYEPNYFRGRARAVRQSERTEASVVPVDVETWHLRYHDEPRRYEVLLGPAAEAYERLLSVALAPGEMYIDMTPRRRPGDPRDPRNQEEGP